VISLEGDRSPGETGADLMSGTTPNPTSSFYRFSGDFWDRAGFSVDALRDNRLGRLDEEQVHLIFDLFQRPGEWFLLLYAAAMVNVWVNGAITHPSLGLSIAAGTFVLVILAIFAFGLGGLWRDANSGRVESFCGELTKWEDFDPEGPDLYGLRHGSFSVDLPTDAFTALPKTAHYRIYFTPTTHKVVNVEEHGEDAPH
jgi:hypothetical protein